MDLIGAFAGVRNQAMGGASGNYALLMEKKAMKAEEAHADKLLEMLPEQQAAVPKGKNLDVFA